MMGPVHEKDDDTAAALLRAAAETLRPIVRKLLASGVPFGRLESQLRELYVEVADSDFGRPGRRQTQSRIALLTGINRKEVRRLRAKDGAAPPPASFSRNQAASLISLWMSGRSTIDARGKPRPLPYVAEQGPSFSKLAQEVTADVSPRAILDALVESGAAEIQRGGRVALKAPSYVPRLGRPQKLGMLAEDPGELVAAMLHNIFAERGAEPWLQRKAFFDNIGSDGIVKLRETLRRAGEGFLRQAERTLARSDRDRNPDAPGGDRLGVGFGVYYFEKRGGQNAPVGNEPFRKPRASPRSKKR